MHPGKTTLNKWMKQNFYHLFFIMLELGPDHGKYYKKDPLYVNVEMKMGTQNNI